MISGGGQLLTHAGPGMFGWGTGGFALPGERINWGRRPIDTVRLESQWRRTYPADTAARSDTSATISCKARW